LVKDSPDQLRRAQADQNRMAARMLHTYLDALVKVHPSPAVRERAEKIDRRFHEEVGSPYLISRALDRYVSWKLKRADKKPPPATVSDPPPRWSYYNTFDERVWVRKGREAKKPVPYRSGWIIGRKH